MADTMVVERSVKAPIRAALIITVISCFVVSVILVHEANERQNKAAELFRTISKEGSEVAQLENQINVLRAGGSSIADLQQNSGKLLPLLDRYEGSIRRMQAAFTSLLDQKLVLPEKEGRLQALRPMCSTMLEIVEVERRQATTILSFNPGQPPQLLRAQLQPLTQQFARLQRTLVQENQDLQEKLRSGELK